MRPILATAWLVLSRFYVVLRFILQRWIRRYPGLVSRILESALWPAVVVYLCWLSRPANPFYIDDGFPWPWVGPWLIALRYGVGYGFASVVGLLVTWSMVAPDPAFPRLYFLGGAIMTLIAGEFGSYWRMRMTRLQESLDFLNDKVERLTRRLYLVKLSHDELEYEMVDRPGTLRESLIQLRVLMDHQTRSGADQGTAMPGAQAMLDFILQQCRVDSAAMYSVRMEPHLELTQVATSGGMEAVSPTDPIVVHALETGHSVHLQDALMALSKRKQIIAVTPMISTQGQPFGFLAIGSMPFTSLNNENLQTIAVLLESYSDYLRLTLQANEILADWPDAPRSLAGEFAWLNRLRVNFGQPSRCAVWRIQHAHEQDMLNHLHELHSRGETAWRWPVGRIALVEARSKPCVIALVPFTDEAGMRVYTQRIFDSMAKSFPDLSAEQLDVQDFALGQADSFAYLRQLAEGLYR